MPVTVEIADEWADQKDIDTVFEYFSGIDNRFSTFKPDSEISRINKKLLKTSEYSTEMREILALCEETKKITGGYFDINHNNISDPSGLVKGWAIWNAYNILRNKKFKNFYIDAGGDIQLSGKNKHNNFWTVGIRNPFNRNEIVKVLSFKSETSCGIATSGTYVRGQHIYDPHNRSKKISDILSLTVIGPNILDADRFATAAFAMGRKGIYFIEKLEGFEGYMITKEGNAIFTSGINKFSKDKTHASTPG